jgi:CrcB protein
MLNCLVVGLGGFLGSVCRYLIGLLPIAEGSGFPFKTLCINVFGAFAIGLIAFSAPGGKAWDPTLVLLLKVGICGGFTTFSTFALETFTLLQKDAWMAAGYLALSALLGLAAIAAARALVG